MGTNLRNRCFDGGGGTGLDLGSIRGQNHALQILKFNRVGREWGWVELTVCGGGGVEF